MASILFALMWGAVMIFGALRSEDPLIRQACWLGLLSLAFVGAALGLTGRRSRRWLLPPFALATLIALPGSLATSIFWGGGALNGRVSEDRYFLVDHGRESETTRLRYGIVATLETTVLVSMPAVFLLLSHKTRRRENRPSADDRDDE